MPPPTSFLSRKWGGGKRRGLAHQRNGNRSYDDGERADDGAQAQAFDAAQEQPGPEQDPEWTRSNDRRDDYYLADTQGDNHQ